MIFTSALALMYVLLDSNGWDGAEAAFRSFAIGRTVLASLAQHDRAAERGQRILNVGVGRFDLPALVVFESNTDAETRS